MGTLGKTWTLPDDVRKKRYERFMKTWRSKPRTPKRDTIRKIVEARKRQAENGRAPETNDLIREKISQSMKEYREENGVWNTGRHYRLPNSKSVGKVTIRGVCRTNAEKLTAEQRRRYCIEHNKAVLKMADRLRKKGMSVWTCLDPIPDLIVKHKGKIIAVEVTEKKYIPIAVEFKHEDTRFFDEVRWVGWDGRRRDVCEKH